MRHVAAFAAVPGLEGRSRQESLLLIVAYIAVPTVKVLVKEQMHLPTSHAPRFYSKEERAVSLRSNWDRDPVMFFGVTRIEKLEGFAVAWTSHQGVKRFFVRRVIDWDDQTLEVRRYWHHCAASSRPNDEVERRGAATAPNEGSLSRSSIPSLAHRRYNPRSPDC
jgi:hypothetical protein